MRPTTRRVLLVVLALVFLGSAAMVLQRLIQYRQGEAVYSEAAQLVELPDLSTLPTPTPAAQPDAAVQSPAPIYQDPYADALRDMDFTALRQVNEEVLGWIVIPDTRLSYPVVQGADNQYYLNHTWRKTANSVGAVFMEHTNHSDLSDFNTIIYGHRMNDRSMFGMLKQYKSQSYWAAHPCVYISDDRGSHRYEIFAAYEVGVSEDTYRLGFSTLEAKQSFLDFCTGASVLDTGIVPTVNDRILTLSTCTGSGHATRWVVQAVERGALPAESAPAPEPSPTPETPAGPEPSSVPEETASPAPTVTEEPAQDTPLPAPSDGAADVPEEALPTPE